MSTLQLWEVWAKHAGWNYLGPGRATIESEVVHLLQREARRFGLFGWYPGYAGLFKSEAFDGKALYAAYRADDAVAFAAVLGVSLPAHEWTETVERLALEIKALPSPALERLMDMMAQEPSATF